MALSHHPKLAFYSSAAPEALDSTRALEARYGGHTLDEADVVVVLGGDGAVLKAMHALLAKPRPVFALRRTHSVGFLCNSWDPDHLYERIAKAHAVNLHPLRAEAVFKNGHRAVSYAFNEVAVIRDTPQSAKLRVDVDGITRLDKYSGDGLLLSTPAGSTAYNHSCGGPILPLDANTLVMTAISGFRPRRWTYAVLRQTSLVSLDVLEIEKRPVRLEAGQECLHDLMRVTIALDQNVTCNLLFDPSEHLGERILREQFTIS